MNKIITFTAILILSGCAVSERAAYEAADRRIQESDEFLAQKRVCDAQQAVVVQSDDGFWCESRLSNRPDRSFPHMRGKRPK